MKRETAIVFALLAAIAGSAAFIAAYATGGNRLYEGLSLALAAAALSAAAVGWAFWILPPECVVDEIDESRRRPASAPSPRTKRPLQSARSRAPNCSCGCSRSPARPSSPR